MDQSIGKNGTGVQIDGNGNTVIVTAAGVRPLFSRPQLRKAEPTTELELLRVDIRATHLVGRERELADLEAWLATPKPISFRCLRARAGTGKTRLGVELCERAEKTGWTAGFVQTGPFQDFVTVAADWSWSTPTLVVVDYAASLTRELRAWLDCLAAAEPPEEKLRILLLERHADAELGWWPELTRVETFSGPSAATFADPRTPIALASLGALEDRRALLAETMRHAGRITGTTPVPRPPMQGESADFDRRLSDDRTDNEPLYLMMAGVEAVHSSAPAALRLGRGELADNAAAREAARLRRLAQQGGVPEALLTHLALCVTLQGGCGFEEGLRLLREETAALSIASPLGPETTLDRFAEALPRSASGEIDAMRPDLVGEAFILALMRPHHRYPATERGIVERAVARAPGKVAATLIRTAQDFADGRSDHKSVAWLDHIIGHSEDVDELIAVKDAIPAQTLALRESAVAVSDRLVTIFRSLPSQREDFKPYFAGLLNDLGVSLSGVGQREGALDAGREAVDLRRQLAAQRPDAFRPDLAASLNNLANMLSEVGQREDALDAARESVDIRRALAAQRPDAFRPDLAMSLNNLAAMLAGVGQREAALDAAREALDLRRVLAAQLPDAFRPALALSLNNLANSLSQLGQRKAALDAAREATNLCRELAAQRPDAFRPALALSLYTLANGLSEIGQREAALDAAREAVDLRRELAAQRPDAFRPALALSLNSLANSLSEVGQREAAVDAAREAAELYRELAAQRPDAIRPDLAGSLNNLANRLSEVGQREAALDAAREAVNIRRELAARRPDAFRPDLALSLNNLANSLREVGQREAALDAAREASDLYRELAAQRPDAFRPDLARSLGVTALCLSALNSAAAAQESSLEAIDTLAAPFFARPPAFAGLMSAIVQHHLAHCEAAGCEPDAARLNPIIEKLNDLSGGNP